MTTKSVNTKSTWGVRFVDGQQNRLDPESMNQGNYGPPPAGGYGPSMGYPQQRPPRRSGPSAAVVVAALTVLAAVVFGGCLALFVATRGHATAPAAAAAVSVAAAEPAPTPAPKPPTEAERLMATETLPEALAILTPKFDDSTNDTDPGALALAIWAGAHMKWSDVAVTKDETSFALAQKDIDAARGKRLCVSGRIIQIEVDTIPGPTKVSVGILNSNPWGLGNLYKFVNVASSGTIVGNDQTRMCGVVTGKYDYSNSAGGVGHALQIVGMFDLPENKPDAGK